MCSSALVEQQRGRGMGPVHVHNKPKVKPSQDSHVAGEVLPGADDALNHSTAGLPWGNCRVVSGAPPICKTSTKIDPSEIHDLRVQM